MVSTFAALAQEKTVDLAQRVKSFTVPEDFKVDVWADTSLTQNPSFFYFDSKGKLLITELYRLHNGVGDVRRFSQDAMIADIEIETLSDRLALFKDFPEQFPDNQQPGVSDRIVILEDTNKDGKADTSKVFADGFNQPLDGLGVGVIERDNKVYFTNIPHLWVLEDTNNDGISDQRQALHTGFGTRMSFIGHDLHGLAWGPDGRLYWSLGDRGYDVMSKEGKRMFGPNQGAVFRSEPDGSNLEVFYYGLRNPQELAFDQFGNLFTGDNDGDRGDTERVNHLIEGGDSGWHAGHQSIMSFTQKLSLRSAKYTDDNNIPVAWLTNHMSTPRNQNQPAFMLPGITQFFRGPSGITYNPSDYLGEQWRNSFFMAHFGGSPSRSYITTFKPIENGASFTTTEPETIVTGVNVSDIDFGPDGRLYVSEFNFGGWGGVNQGAIYAIQSKSLPSSLKQKHQTFNNALLADYSQKSITELIHMLSTDHQKIRQQTQFELAKRGQAALVPFKTVAVDSRKDVFSRIHSIWGLSQLVFNEAINKQELASLIPLLADDNKQVRAQTARVLGDHNAQFSVPALTQTLKSDNGQAAMYAAIGLGRIGSTSAVPVIIKKLAAIGDKDLWLRHALVMALKGMTKESWIMYKNHTSADVRMALLLALRALNDPQVAEFLHDKSQRIVNEAIVAIDDKGLTTVRGKVAKLLDPKLVADTEVQAFIHHRIINANYNQGASADAERLLKYAASQGLKVRLASEALAAIEAWQQINPIDTVTGLPTLANKNRADIQQLIVQYLPQIFANTQGQAMVQAMRLAKQVNFELSEQVLVKITQDTLTDSNIRIQALDLLMDDYPSAGLIASKGLLMSDNIALKVAALSKVVAQDKPAGLTVLVDFLNSTSSQLQQAALNNIPNSSNTTIDTLLIKKLQALVSGNGNNAISLELIAAAQKSTNAKIKTLLADYQQKMQSSDILTQFASTLAGGDAQQGHDIFFTSGAAQCGRCHKVGDKGSSVGPDLSQIAQRYSKEYLLQALVDPSAAIAPGFGTFNLTLLDGKVVSGLFYAETADTVTLGKEGDTLITYEKSSIQHIQRPPSGMPPMNYILTKPQIRDLLAYLATLKSTKQRKNSH